MPRRKKKVSEMTDEELKHHIFPKRVLDELQRIAHEHDDDEDSEPEPAEDD